jgi:hypothetical protein
MTRRVSFPPAFLVLFKRETSHGKVTMPDDSAARPFKWSEIHDQVEKKILELLKNIRAETGAAVNPVPSQGGAQQRYFTLLGEKADGWADGAADIYKERLAQVCREDDPRARLSVWSNDLYFFIDDDLRELLLVVCGFGPRDHQLLMSGTTFANALLRKYPIAPDVLDAQETAIAVHRIIYRVTTRLQAEWGDRPQRRLAPTRSWQHSTVGSKGGADG